MKILIWKCPKCGATNRAVSSSTSWQQIGIVCQKDKTLIKPSVYANIDSTLWLDTDLGQEKELELRVLPPNSQ